MSDMAAAGNDAGQQQGEAQGQDLSGISQTLEALSSGQEELRQFLQSAPWSQEDVEAVQEADPRLDLSFLQDYQDPTVEPQNFAEQLQPAIEQLVQQRIEAATRPLQEQWQEKQNELAARDLVDEFPELAQPDVAHRAIDTARQLAEQFGVPELANNPKLWRISHMLEGVADRANSEGREVPQAAHLEGGGGATPAGSQVDLADMIVNGDNGRKGASVLNPFG